MSIFRKVRGFLQYENEEPGFVYKLYFDNTRRLIIFNLVVLIMEGLLLTFFRQYLTADNYYFSAILLLILSVTMPVLLYMRIALRQYDHILYRLFIVGILLLLSVLTIDYTLSIQAYTDRITPFLFCLFSIAALIQFKPQLKIILIIFLDIIFLTLLTSFQRDVNIVVIHFFNVLLMSFIAGMFSYMTYNFKKNNFSYVKTIQNKTRQLKEMTLRDSMTGLYNHNFAYKSLASEINRFERYGQPFSILLFDIDDYKQINDKYGHIIGDRVLHALVKTLNQLIRKSDLAFRYGGDEFLVLFPNTKQSDAAIIAEKLRDSIGNITFEDIALNQITISGAVLQYQNQSVTKFIQDVDSKLYQAKKMGKNCIYR